jgi:hypothetical protein
MLKELFDAIGEQAIAAEQAKVITLPGKRGDYALQLPNGTIEYRTAPPDRHGERIDRLTDLRHFISHELAGKESRVYVEEKAVTAVYDQADRRDRVVWPLKLSEPYQWLANNAAKQLDQAGLLRVLRIVFRNCLMDGNLIPLIRQLKFNAAGEANADLQHGRESMGKSVLNAAARSPAAPSWPIMLFILAIASPC